jgi:hypothetical protein
VVGCKSVDRQQHEWVRRDGVRIDNGPHADQGGVPGDRPVAKAARVRRQESFPAPVYEANGGGTARRTDSRARPGAGSREVAHGFGLLPWARGGAAREGLTLEISAEQPWAADVR